jgi:hypothetical protein
MYRGSGQGFGDDSRPGIVGGADNHLPALTDKIGGAASNVATLWVVPGCKVWCGSRLVSPVEFGHEVSVGLSGACERVVAAA